MSKQHDIVASQDSSNEYDEDVVVNPSANPHFEDILAARLSRRVALKGGITTAASALLGGSILSACGSSDDSPAPAPAPAPQPAPLKIGFNAVAKNKNDLVTVADGYNVSILHAMGDPLHFGDESWKDDGSESAESYNRRIGDGHDGMYWFGMSDAGAFDAKRSDRGLLAVNTSTSSPRTPCTRPAAPPAPRATPPRSRRRSTPTASPSAKSSATPRGPA